MAHRKSLIQVKFRFRQDLLRRMEREAKRHDRSTNDEIARRLERSLEKDEADDQARKIEEAFQANYLASVPPEKIGGELLGLAGIGGPLGRRLSMAAIITEQGKAAALHWLSMEQRAKGDDEALREIVSADLTERGKPGPLHRGSDSSDG
jgi:hypothetical protein